MKTLLRRAVECLEDGRDPFSTEELSAARVTLEECEALSSTIAAIVGGWLESPKEVRHMVVLAHAVKGTKIPVEVVNEVVQRGALLERLRGMSRKER